MIRRTVWIAIALTLFGVALANAQDVTYVDHIYFAIDRDDAPVRNFVFLMHRVSALIWILVEWIAAIILIRMHGYLKARLSASGPGN